MKTKLTLAKSAVLLGLLVWAQTASAFYNSSTGRWLSRDPAEEDEGGLNLCGFVNNDPVVGSDEMGLSIIEFASDSITQSDPPGFPWVTKSESYSGPSSSPNASYSQAVIDIFSILGFSHPNGLCNTGQHDSKYFDSIQTHHIGSFVQALMKNNDTCCWKVTVHCSLGFVVTMSSSVKTFASAGLEGHLLSRSYERLDRRTRFSTTYSGGFTHGSGAFADSDTVTVQLAPKATYELYNVYPSISGWRLAPGGFTEAVGAKCELATIVPCDD